MMFLFQALIEAFARAAWTETDDAVKKTMEGARRAYDIYNEELAATKDSGANPCDYV